MSRVKTTFNLDSDDLLDLLMKSAGAETYRALADFLEVSQQSVSNARAHKRIPDAWVLKVSQKKNIPIETIIKKKDAPSEDREAQKIQEIRIPYGVSGAGGGKGEYGVMLHIAQDWVDK